MNEKLDRILKEVSDVRKDQAVTNTRLDHYNELLREHMRRTEISERRLDELYRYKWLAVGAIAVVTFAIQILGKAILK